MPDFANYFRIIFKNIFKLLFGIAVRNAIPLYMTKERHKITFEAGEHFKSFLEKEAEKKNLPVGVLIKAHLKKSLKYKEPQIV